MRLFLISQPKAFINHPFIHVKEKEGKEECNNEDGGLGLIQAEQIHDQRMNFNAS